VDQIQTATNQTVMATEEGSRTVDASTGLVQRTAQVFGEVVASISSAYKASEQISLNARQQSEAIGQVVAAMSSLRDGTRETATGISLTRSGLEQLYESSRGLKDMVGNGNGARG
jgi:methyl-accepting chemotaxis protein